MEVGTSARVFRYCESAALLALFTLFVLGGLEYYRKLNIAYDYRESLTTLSYASTVQSVREWRAGKFSRRNELVQIETVDHPVFFVHSLEEFVTKSFSTTENNPRREGFVVYPEKALARYNFQFLDTIFVGDKVHWEGLDCVFCDTIFPTEDAFVINTQIAIHGVPLRIHSYTQLYAIINNDELYEHLKRERFGRQGLEFLRNPPSSTWTKYRKEDGATILYDPDSNLLGFIRSNGTFLRSYQPSSADHSMPNNILYFHAL